MVLRDTLDLKGAKYGCGIAQCGACTVIANGAAIRSCVTPVEALADADVLTIEGVGAKGLSKLQQAWLDHQVPQCGYCQTGQIMQATALLKDIPKPTDEEIDAGMAGNICRCGTYVRIRAAIKQAAGV